MCMGVYFVRHLYYGFIEISYEDTLDESLK